MKNSVYNAFFNTINNCLTTINTIWSVKNAVYKKKGKKLHVKYTTSINRSSNIRLWNETVHSTTVKRIELYSPHSPTPALHLSARPETNRKQRLQLQHTHTQAPVYTWFPSRCEHYWQWPLLIRFLGKGIRTHDCIYYLLHQHDTACWMCKKIKTYRGYKYIF